MGFEMILKNINQILKDEGVEKINLKVGDLFDSSMHFAIENRSSDTIEKDHIIEVNQNGYKLHDRLIKPAIVVTSTGKTKEDN